jgi:SDR family mycofactocin-dependent oxidoreductase
MGLLEGKVAFITGGARGQGRAHAVTCAREGADVVIFDLAAQLSTVPYPMATPSDADVTVEQVTALGQRCVSVFGDVRSQRDLDAAVAVGIVELGHIDILIANAGIWVGMPFWQFSDEQWEQSLDVNLTGVWRSAKAVARHMIERESGSIVITSSMNGVETAMDNSAYTAGKHGVIGLMKSIALELARFGIRCNAVCPGAINTPMTNHPLAWAKYAGHEGGAEAEMLESGYRYHVLKGKGFLSPQVIADTALYLNSDLASAVTGAAIPVDAGHLLLPGVNQTPNK